MEVTQKIFAFPQKHNIPLYYVSASDGTNVVKVLWCYVNFTQDCFHLFQYSLPWSWTWASSEIYMLIIYKSYVRSRFIVMLHIHTAPCTWQPPPQVLKVRIKSFELCGILFSSVRFNTNSKQNNYAAHFITLHSFQNHLKVFFPDATKESKQLWMVFQTETISQDY